ncbi:WD repeat-containing protein [Klebsormidium nitens]|uniref:Cilia- and flagella-associated protein 43 n=1 Tax=Klebsormidium nitens TaxID=105231 RepID=A0A1Y1HZ22_KLENI|nr:WD repeat-containing protein [Klebsormidium nitens]|eukprot:GAQ83920.1 WD repeat-containing protein [Klebsormidium nitens]
MISPQSAFHLTPVPFPSFLPTPFDFPDIAELEIVRLAFFADGARLLAASGVPDFELTVHDVSTAAQQARTKLGAPLDDVSFNPRNDMQFCSRSGGVLTLWTLERSYETHYLTSKALPTDRFHVTSHAWAQNGALLAGCSTGELLLIDSETGRVRGPQFLEQLDRKNADAQNAIAMKDPAVSGAGVGDSQTGIRKLGPSATEKGNKIPLGPVLPGVNTLPGKLGGVGAKSIKPGGRTVKTAGAAAKGIPEVLPGDNEPVVHSPSGEPLTLLAVNETHVIYGGSRRGLEVKELRAFAGPLQPASMELSPVKSFKRQSGLVVQVSGRQSPDTVKGLTKGFEPLVDEERFIDLDGLAPVSLIQNPSQAQQMLVVTSDGTVHTCDVSSPDSKSQSADVSRFQRTDSRSSNLSLQSSSIDENAVPRKKEIAGATVHPQSSFHFGGLSGLAVLTPLKLLVTAGGKDKALSFWGMERGNFVARKGLTAKVTCLQACESKNLLAWGSDCGVVRILHVDATTEFVTTFRQRLHVAPVHRLRFSASGAFLASQSADGRIVFSYSGHGWDLNPIGYFNLTEDVLDFRWSPRESTEGTLFLSLVTGEIVRLEVPETASPSGERLFGNADLKRASFNVDEPVLSFEIVPANKTAGVNEALLVGMTADKSIRHYTLPDGTGDWTGPGGRPRAPVFERSAHAKPGGALGLSADGKVTVTGAADGALQLRPTLRDIPSQDAGELQLHDAYSGGIRHVAVSSGRVFTAGADGVVFVCDAVDAGIVRTDGRKERRSTRNRNPPNPGELADVNAPDSPTEPDFAAAGTEPELPLTPKMVEVKKVANEPVEESECDYSEGDAVRRKVDELRRRFRECEERNENAPEEEQLPRSDFVVDMDLQAALSADGAARVGKVRAQIAAAIARAQLLAARLKAEFWDVMETHTDVLCPLSSGSDVENFPLRKTGPEEESATEAAEKRRAELEQARADSGTPETDGRETPMEAASTGVLAETGKDSARGAPEEGPDPGAKKESPADGKTERTTSGGADSATQSLLYGPFELTSVKTKKVQIQLLKLVVREKKASFNAQFVAARARKQAAMDKVAEVNARLKEIQKDLGLTEPLTSYAVQDRERNDSLLTVRDSEIKVERYVSPEELRRIEEERKAEEERLRSKKGDDPQERALRDMMGGKLQSKADEEAQEELQRPDWMSGERAKMSEDQIKQIKEFEAKEKAFKEEKEKKRKGLELEYKRLLEEAVKPVAAFDDELTALRKHRSHVLSECLEVELQIARLGASIIAEEETDQRQQINLTAEVESLRATSRDTAAAAAHFRQEAEEKKDEYEMVLAEDKAMEKGFKRDFADCGDAADALFRLFKRRAKKGSATGEPPAAASPTSENSNKIMRKSQRSLSSMHSFKMASPPESGIRNAPDAPGNDGHLDYSDKPETISDLQWERFLSARERKIAQEEEARARGAQLAEMQRHVARLAEEDDVAKKRLEDAAAALASFKEKREERRKDLDVPFHIKQGLVEVDLDPFTGGLHDASLLHRSAVEEVNAEVRKHGQQKIDILTAIKDFKKGIYEAQWQVAKLGMDEEDLTEQIKQFQLLRVTKQLQTVIKNGEDISSANEVAALENRLAHDQKLHEKKLQERAALLRKLEKQSADITAQTAEVKKRLATLQEQAEAHARIREIQVSSQAARRNATERMKSLVTQRQLQDIARAQMEEITALQNELEVLRKRTFPKFDTAPRARFVGPDERLV